MKCGFVAILGKTNVGKSTILNAIIKEKVSIVSPKPQTTRNNIIGILNEPDCQIIFTDTPGIHRSENKLDSFMEKSVNVAKNGVDVILVVLDGTKRIKDDDIAFIESFKNSNANVLVLVNKIDQTTFEKLYPQLNKLNSLEFVKEIIPLSGLKGKNVDVLVESIKKYIPQSDVIYYENDIYTDKSVKFMISELIREKTLWLLHEEIPHGIAVEVPTYKEEKEKIIIDADIICEKASHKQIIIGKNGSMLKEIGSKARADIEKLVGKHVFLNIFVKVEENWRNKNVRINDFGYNLKDLD